MNSEESVFVRKALEDVEKAEKYLLVKQIVVTLLAFAAAVWVVFQPSGSGRNGAYTVIILTGMMLAVCTVKIMSLMNKNTRAVLRAIADLQRR
jgi:hypothetical protein